MKNNNEKRPVGAPITVDGRRINVYLDKESIQIAAKLGKGNISEGIRMALRLVMIHEEDRFQSGR